MTHVYLEQDGNRYPVTAKDHATGSVEMCAAISTLVYTLEGWLRNSTVLVLECTVEDGHVHIVFAGGSNCETVFDMVTVGFLRLQATDPEHVCVELQIIS